jgi:hypothetical protein
MHDILQSFLLGTVVVSTLVLELLELLEAMRLLLLASHLPQYRGFPNLALLLE